MVKTQVRGLLKGLLVTAGMMGAFAPSAHAAWTFANTANAGSTVFNGNAGESATLKLSAVSAGNTNFAAATGASTWSAATLTNQGDSGQGACSTGDGSSGCVAPDHAVDNNVNTEAVLLNFSSSVVLKSIGLGWTNSSTSVDMTLFRYVGTGTPTGTGSPLIGQTAKSMTGWELVGNYGDMIADTTTPYNLVNGQNKGSSWWMISAYNSGYTGAVGETRGSFEAAADYFKLYGVTASNCVFGSGKCGGSDTSTGVPEPGSLALAGLALFGVVYTRRQSKAKQV